MSKWEWVKTVGSILLIVALSVYAAFYVVTSIQSCGMLSCAYVVIR